MTGFFVWLYLDSMDELLDKDLSEINPKIVLNSKVSIATAIILLSPLFGAILYADNLRKTDQNNKVFGTITAVIMCNLFVFLPLLGFDFGVEHLPAQALISRSITCFLVLFVFWNKQLKNHKRSVVFPVRLFLILTALAFIFAKFGIIQLLFFIRFPYVESMGPGALFILILVGKTIIDLIKGEPFYPNSKKR